jgi:Glu-tRNA(Gln) amidotransferase subunit E-like FAD-binding protein
MFTVERSREKYEVENMPEREIEEIHEIFEEYKVERSALQPLIQHLKANPKIWVDFMVIIKLIAR